MRIKLIESVVYLLAWLVIGAILNIIYNTVIKKD